MTLISDWSPPRHSRQSVIPTTSLTMATILDESTNMLITSTPAPKSINCSQSNTTTKQLACRRLFSEHQVHHHCGDSSVYDGVITKHHYPTQQLYHEEDEQFVLMTEWLDEGTSMVRYTSAYTSYLPSEYIVEHLEEIEEEEEGMDANGNLVTEDDERIEDMNESILLLSGVIRSEGSVDIACHPQSEQLLELDFEPITFDQYFEDEDSGSDDKTLEQIDDHQFYSINKDNSMTTNMEHLDLATSSSLGIMMSCSSSVGGTPKATSMTYGSLRRERDVGSSVFDESPCGSPCVFKQQPTKRQRLVIEDSSEGAFFSQPRLFTNMDTMKEDASLFSHSQPAKFVQPISIRPISSIFTQEVSFDITRSLSSHSPIKSILPCHASPKDAIPRVTPETVADLVHNGLMVNEHCHHKLVIIDCRYPYEYEGGHIPGAINVSSLADIDTFLSCENEETADALSKTVYIFHCEFSSERAPRMALHVRKQDRLRNAHRYPVLSVPNVYIMEGGYKSFWQLFPAHCSPPYHYRPMLDGAFKPELRACQKASKAVTRQKKAAKISENGGCGSSPVTFYAVRRGFKGQELMTSGISSEL